MRPGDQWNARRPQRLRASRFAGVGASRGCDVSGTWRSAWTVLTLSPSARESLLTTRSPTAVFGPLSPSCRGRNGSRAEPRGCASSSAICCRSPSSLAARRRRSTRPSGIVTAGRSLRHGRERESTMRSSTWRRSGGSGRLRRRIHARICSFRLPGSTALAQAELVMRSSSTSVAVSSPSQSGGRRSSQAGKAARSSRRAGSRGAIRSPR